MKRPYECKVAGCDKGYTTRFSLRRHIASHSAIKQHVCVLCFKTFTLAQYLKEHTYIHTQQKPFKCDYEGCTRAFRQAGKLSMHKKVHQNIIFSIHRVKRNRLDSSSASAKQASPALGPVAQPEPKSTVTLSLQKQQNNIRQHNALAMDDIDFNQNCMVAAGKNQLTSSNGFIALQGHQHAYESDTEKCDDQPIGEDTERELSLSREDDSDLSVVSDCAEEEYKCDTVQQAALAEYSSQRRIDNQHQVTGAQMANGNDLYRQAEHVNAAAAVAEERDGDLSDSESIEDSIIGEEESEYDEAAQQREEHIKLQQIFEKRDLRTSCISGSKVKLPYEMLINKLIDGLETPDLINQKELPRPTAMQQSQTPIQQLMQSHQHQEPVLVAQEEKLAGKSSAATTGVFATAYSRLATGVSEPETVPQKHVAAAPSMPTTTIAAPIAMKPQQQLQIVQLQPHHQFLQAATASHVPQQICYQIPTQFQYATATTTVSHHQAQPQLQFVQLIPTNFMPIQLQAMPATVAPQQVLMQYTAVQPKPLF